MQPHNPYQAPVAAVAPNAAAGGGYEFDQLQNREIEKTADRTRLWGIVSLIGGIVALLLTLVFIVGIVSANLLGKLGTNATVAFAIIFGFFGPLGLVYTVVGKLYIDSGNALKAVVTTAGNDVAHLMTALDKLANAFRLEVIMSAIGFAIGFSVSLLTRFGVLGVS